MKNRCCVAILVLLCVFLAGIAPAGADDGDIQRVVTSVTTDDVNRAAMAIAFTRGIMQEKQVEGILFFNVYGVNLVNAGKDSPVYGNGKTVAQMLREFMDAGGVVMACPMCMQHVGGMTSADLVQGVSAVKGGGVKAVSGPRTLALSY
ncbi:DsrE family protein [Oleidesulfovibrio alaskensis]